MFALLIFMSLGLTAFVFMGNEGDPDESTPDPVNEVNGTNGDDELTGDF